MSDEKRVEEEEEEAPEGGLAFKEGSDNDIEVVIDDGTVAEEAVPEEFKGLSKTQIIEKLKEVEKKVAEKDDQKGIYERLGTAIERLGVPPASAPTVQPSSPAPSEEELERRRTTLNEKFVSDPAAAAEELFTSKLGPMVAQTLSGNLSLARQVMELDPEKGPSFKKYAAEIDKMVNEAPIQAKVNPQIYQQAYKQVISNHIDEIIDEKVASAIAKERESAKTATPARSAPFSEGRGASSRPTRATVTIKKEEADRLRLLGIDPTEYGQAVLGRKE